MAAVGPMFGISRMQSIRAGMLLAAGGEFAFVAFGESFVWTPTGIDLRYLMLPKHGKTAAAFAAGTLLAGDVEVVALVGKPDQLHALLPGCIFMASTCQHPTSTRQHVLPC